MTFDHLTTADIGIAIRDHLDEQAVEALDWESPEPFHNPPHGTAQITGIDVSDAHNPIIHTNAGTFRVSIVRIG